MKTSDLEVGTDYAYEPWKRARPERVTVLDKNVYGVDQSGFGGRGGKRNGLVKVAYATGEQKGREFLVRPQTLLRTWKKHHAAAVSAGRYRAQQARKDQVELEANSALAFALHQKMLAAGAPLETESVYDDSQHAALVEAGFSMVPKSFESYGRGDLFVTFNVSTMLDKGTVPVEVVKVLMGEKPEVGEYDGLGAWDLDYIAEGNPEGVADFKAAYEAASKVGA